MGHRRKEFHAWQEDLERRAEEHVIARAGDMLFGNPTVVGAWSDGVRTAPSEMTGLLTRRPDEDEGCSDGEEIAP